MLYKYPIKRFPYEGLVEENQRRSKKDEEYELIDTGAFDDQEYFDIFLEYAKCDYDDILAKATIHNRSDKEASIVVLPTFWFRNTWRLQYATNELHFFGVDKNHLNTKCAELGVYHIYFEMPKRSCFAIMKPITKRFMVFQIRKSTLKTE